jgi:hypothetical protein
MLSTLLRQVTDRTAVLENFIRLSSACDGAAGQPLSVLAKELRAQHALPGDLAQEKTFRHCAIITQLYSVYEFFAEACISFWLARLPRYQAFSDLSTQFKNTYRYGLGRVIQDIGKRRYRNLSLSVVLEKYLHSLGGESPWEFVNEALTFHATNLRKPDLEQLFGSAGIDGVWRSLETNERLRAQLIDGDWHKSLEQMVEDLVTFRNDAAHGTPDDLLGLDILAEWIAFVNSFCFALADTITHRIVRAEANYLPESVLGVVTENLRGNIVIATCDHGVISVGDVFYFLREADCTMAVIESIQVSDADRETVQIDRAGLELGLRTSIEVGANSRLVRIDS